MPPYRQTAIVQIVLPSGATAGSLPLTCEREYGVYLVIEDKKLPAQNFRSPINDEQWRQFLRQLRDCNTMHDPTGYNGARAIRTLGRSLYNALRSLSPSLEQFLGRTGVPRRLVIETTRPELHLLPWGGLNDREGKLFAVGDLSIVQAWDAWNDTPISTSGRLKLVMVLGETQRASVGGLDLVPPDVALVEDGSAAFEAGKPLTQIDVLHLEEHGNAVLNEIADVRATTLPSIFVEPKIALLWSCYSGAANSWGQSPALCLHREGAGMVLSFLAELHNQDAKSISQALYGDVFGPAASRDPESALVRIRARKFREEFEFANWASMTVYLRSPLDLSAIALNGPRVPESGWTDEPGSTFWKGVAAHVGRLQAGSVSGLDASAETIEDLPREAFEAWRGNVIRLDGPEDPLLPEVLRDLNILEGASDDTAKAHPAERLIWFFGKIARYGAPLIVWTNASPRHAEFLKGLNVPSTLTFLLLYGAEHSATVAELVEQNRTSESREACAGLTEESGDEEFSAAYYAFARDENKQSAESFLQRVKSPAERLLLQGNFMSRSGRVVGESATRSLLERQQYQEDCYRQVMNGPGEEAPLREAGRAKHELGYMLCGLGNSGAAEILYRLALEDLERSKARDTRWRGALANVLRDWADLLSGNGERLEEARALLGRAMAINTFHGRRLDIAYGTTTAAQIARTACHFTEAIELAMDAANRFEECRNWRGWRTAMRVLFDTLAETRETKRMLGLAELALAKLERSNLGEEQREGLRLEFLFVKAKALWIAGDLMEAREELNLLRGSKDWGAVAEELRQSADAMAAFLAV